MVNSQRSIGSSHTPVLLQESIDGLALHTTDIVVDGTLGGAGHSLAIAKHLCPKGLLIGLDLDADAIKRAKEKLAHVSCKVVLIQESYRNLAQVLEAQGIRMVDKVLLDLGLSSDQLEQSGRGFSFQRDEPLIMTFTKHPDEVQTTARDIVNDWDEEHIVDILQGFGEERFARRIAGAIVRARSEEPIETTAQLRRIIEDTVPRTRHKSIHPATKTFQALRIAVNDELGAIREGLAAAQSHTAAGGRIAVISFHSMEDRVVKKTFAEWQKNGLGTAVTKKPIVPTDEEIQMNPRARSAKLRIFLLSNDTRADT